MGTTTPEKSSRQNINLEYLITQDCAGAL